MARTRDPNAKRDSVEIRLSPEQVAFLDRSVDGQRFRTKSDVARFGVELMMKAERGETLILTGQAAQAFRQLAKDFELDYDTTGLMASYLMVLFASMAPKTEAQVMELVERVKARAVANGSASPATGGVVPPVGASRGTPVRTDPRLPGARGRR